MLGRSSMFGVRVGRSRPRLVFRHPVHRLHITHRRRAHRRHAPARALASEPWVVGLGAAILALPLGMWLGRKLAH